MKNILKAHPKKLVLAALVVAYAGYAYLQAPKIDPSTQYVFAEAQNNTVTKLVTANGTVNPVKLVSVGTQISGTVKKYYVDFNDKVKEGQVLLEIDDSAYRAQRDASASNLQSAKTSLELARANFARTEELVAKGFVSKKDYDSAHQAVKASQAQVQAAQASLRKDNINVGYSVIRSPVSGVVVTRAVDVGQTVAASLSTPELYKIAQDLSKMRISTSFAEADIASIKEGQKASFTVDAYPGVKFSGLVSQVRLQPTTTNNVVTYNVVIDVDNADLKLLPGMTANVGIETQTAANVLTVPNAALRFKPAQAADKPASDKDGGNKLADKKVKESKVYMLGADGQPAPVKVKTGLSDGSFTQVEAEGLTVGSKVITDVSSTGGKAEGGPGMKFRMF